MLRTLAHATYLFGVLGSWVGDGSYNERPASYCGSNPRSVSGHDKPPVDRSRRRDRPRPVLGTDRPVRMVRNENGRVKGELLLAYLALQSHLLTPLQVVSETHIGTTINSRVLPGLAYMRVSGAAIFV